ncbi:AraC family transcriptional regulator [Sphingobacterium siyangense]|jgi:AraC-like DNA-binding protein|nr:MULTISPECIES: AraC family transcriptional regulator [Sphingobacterium]QQT29241.1 helix-turn-helix domain-containing protein [Sphingobacterium multivorum]QRY59947.1 helix-turn-helix domain-containing protein [Sphingobacterium siyangense]
MMQHIYENFTFPPDQSFTVRSEELEIKKYTSLKSHRNFEIVLLENCMGKRFIGDHIEDFEGDELVLLGSYLPHCWQYYNTIDKDKPATASIVHFYPDFLGKDFLTKPEAILLNQLFINAAKGVLFSGPIVRQAKDILNEMLVASGLSRAVLMLQLLDKLALSNSYRTLSSPSFNIIENSTDANRINRVFDYIFKHFREDITLQDVASIVPMSSSAFCRFFKMQTNRTLVDFIKEIRIGHAAKLLMEGQYNITETCYKSGYNNISNFNKHFKDVKGSSPRDFLKQYRTPEAIYV